MTIRTERGGAAVAQGSPTGRAGVGSITVSRALRDPERVSEHLRQRIAAAVEELGYVPNPSARVLASTRADVIGVLVPSLSNNVFSDVLRGIHDRLKSRRLQIQFGNTHYSPEEEERLPRVFLGQRPSALIVSGIDQAPATRQLLDEAGCPVVQIMEIGSDPIDMMVGFSHFEAGAVVARHLIDAGCQQTGFLGARMDPGTQRRLAGYKAVMEEAGRRALVTTTGAPSSVSMGVNLLHKALERTPGLDAAVCNNDDIALGVLFACQRAGFDVPGRISIAGFNDLDMMAFAFPSITSVRTPRYEIGSRAIAMALAAIAGERPLEKVVDLGFELKMRESTMKAVQVS